MNLTRHAATRIQQRGIPELVVDIVMKFGASQPAGGGTQKLYLDKRGRRQARSFAGPLAGAIEPHLDVYVLVNEHGDVITTAHRIERIVPRH